MKSLTKIKYLLLFTLTSIGGIAQEQENDVVLKAMKDELDRSMSELKHPDFDKPFFIMYGITDQRNSQISATLGALIESDESHYRFKSTTRILVGDYEFNDESLDDNLYSNSTPLDLNVPLDDDYWGIRRSFWASTDNVYRDAARHFNQHKITVKESKKPFEELPHRTFGKGRPVSLIKLQQQSNYDHKQWENTARKLSGVFLDYPEIERSMVSFNFSEGYEYLVNSEGVMTKLPFSKIAFFCVAQSRNEEGELFFDLATHEAMSFDKFPTEKELIADVKAVIENLKKKTTIPKLEEEYIGPVLVMGNSVASTLASSLFSGRENIMAGDELANTTGYMNTAEVDFMNNKIGKPFMNELFSIVARPTLKHFQGTDLFGSFEIDSEGIVPKDEVVLVDKGILKAQLNNRTITHRSQNANGFADGPGVLEITYASKATTQALKTRLLAEAKRAGLEYALIIRDDSGLGIPHISKVWVEDGREEPVRNAAPNTFGFKTLRNLLDASQEQNAVNIGYARNQFGGNGSVTSYIVPKALLLRDVEVQPVPIPALKEEHYVDSPLVKKNK